MDSERTSFEETGLTEALDADELDQIRSAISSNLIAKALLTERAVDMRILRQ